ncbi:WxL domain-containing protein [Enterococcus caccae]|uniref:WxL domain-containing protein n=1 Tax=Enterococcus caccae ATCC BAA-1240 TaxID=1158612 RepID=R3TVN0_9ENTE|nr:WxL domain-containing protein [Enterococcus caccae]EOL45213.1 hypothetical protein UC7_02019 [Enterococcus caccae ATCC BAA-1240]EOT58620.1 hypothetical protein I580_02791 [Enterococcus caccae ATCC BAA-1240]OJG27052.1 hypothetical protein RU98_GL002832 [Enterococcus caccae]
MKKLSILSLLAIISLNVVGTATAFAEGEVEVEEKKASSHIKVGIEPGDDSESTNPIDPEDPENPGEGGTGQTGSLTIDTVTDLDFGTFKLTSNEKILTANKEKKKNPTAQVTDKRGTGAGWTLQVAISDFSSTEKHVLKGAQLSIPKGEIKTNNIDNSVAPETFSLNVNKDPQTIMLAAKDKGLGTWADSYDKKDTQLMIPAGNFAGEYGATLTWTLSNAPK